MGGPAGSSGSHDRTRPDAQQAVPGGPSQAAAGMVITAARTVADPPRSASDPAGGWLIPQASPPGPDPARAGLDDRAVAASARDTSQTGSGMTGDATEPLPVAGDPGRALPGQLARFGELAGRDLSARAFAALRARGAYDPQRPRRRRELPAADRRGTTRDAQPAGRHHWRSPACRSRRDGGSRTIRATRRLSVPAVGTAAAPVAAKPSPCSGTAPPRR